MKCVVIQDPFYVNSDKDRGGEYNITHSLNKIRENVCKASTGLQYTDLNFNS
jgi:hypothetical protein